MKYINSTLIASLVLITGCDKPKTQKKTTPLAPRQIVVSTNSTVGTVEFEIERLTPPEPLITDKRIFTFNAIDTSDNRLILLTEDGSLTEFTLPPSEQTILSYTEFGTNGSFQIPASARTSRPGSKQVIKVKGVSYIRNNMIIVNGRIVIDDGKHVTQKEMPTSISKDRSWGISKTPPPRSGNKVYLWNKVEDEYQQNLFMSNKDKTSPNLRIDDCEIDENKIILVGTVSDENHRLLCVDANKVVIWETDIGSLQSGRISDVELTSNGIVILNSNLRMLSYFTRGGQLVGHLKLSRAKGSLPSDMIGGIQPETLDLGIDLWFSGMTYNPSDGYLYLLGSSRKGKSADGIELHEGFIYRIKGL